MIESSARPPDGARGRGLAGSAPPWFCGFGICGRLAFRPGGEGNLFPLPCCSDPPSAWPRAKFEVGPRLRLATRPPLAPAVEAFWR